MANVELDEVELQRLQKQDRTVHALMANPQAKKKIFEAYRVVEPNARIPELDIEEAAKAPVVELEKTVKALQTQIDTDKAEREKQLKLDALNGNMERGFAKLRSQGWLDDGIENVKKLMEEKGYIDPEDAAAIYLAKHPPQAPATPSGTGSWNFLEAPADAGDSYTKTLLASKGAADNEQLAMNEAHKALNEFRSAQRRS
jgi:hypothetical protein